MHRAAYQLNLYFLSFLLGAALFIFQPVQPQATEQLTSGIRSEMALALRQLTAGESLAAPFQLVWESSAAFYDSASTQALAVLDPASSLVALILEFDGDYLAAQENLKTAFVPHNFMAEPSLRNIVPNAEYLAEPYSADEYLALSNPRAPGKVAGESIEVPSPQPPAPPVGTQAQSLPMHWMTVEDAISGLPYCVAVFNGTVNSYPGTCKYDIPTHAIRLN